jgi:hypothetical protein
MSGVHDFAGAWCDDYESFAALHTKSAPMIFVALGVPDELTQ